MSLTASVDRVSPAAQSSTADLRQHPRVVCMDGGAIRLAVRPEFRGRRCVLIDISSGGIGLVLQDPLAAETILVFDVNAGPGMESIGRLARVRHCRPHPVPPDAPWLPRTPLVSRVFRSLFSVQAPQPTGQAWFVGCEFDRPLSETDLQQLVNRLHALANPLI